MACYWKRHQVRLISVPNLPLLFVIMINLFNVILSRQAQELGLHRHKNIYQSGPNSIDETLSLIWYEEYKNRVWINLFVWDR